MALRPRNAANREVNASGETPFLVKPPEVPVLTAL